MIFLCYEVLLGFFPPNHLKIEEKRPFCKNKTGSGPDLVHVCSLLTLPAILQETLLSSVKLGGGNGNTSQGLMDRCGW